MHLVLLPILGIRTYLQLIGLTGMEFEMLKKKKIPTDRPIPEKQSRVRGNKSIFKVGLIDFDNSTLKKFILCSYFEIYVSMKKVK